MLRVGLTGHITGFKIRFLQKVGLPALVSFEKRRALVISIVNKVFSSAKKLVTVGTFRSLVSTAVGRTLISSFWFLEEKGFQLLILFPCSVSTTLSFKRAHLRPS